MPVAARDSAAGRKRLAHWGAPWHTSVVHWGRSSSQGRRSCSQLTAAHWSPLVVDLRIGIVGSRVVVADKAAEVVVPPPVTLAVVAVQDSPCCLALIVDIVRIVSTTVAIGSP